ncbi:hypothetical protein HPB48_010974 [Haemaphysalis longicornis]|uniref:Uncharacterized protein n=1 Tax=Haemaphysalis longicornis TaxID=44386 RepID=A0A9J6GN75_HAELO|nr:hypothetical protein HPB48_010974 [Haemaphysalis longicornis]
MASNFRTSTTTPVRIFSRVCTSKLSKNAKQVIANVYARTRMRFPAKSVQEVLSVVSEDTGVSPRTVAKLKAECLRGNLVSPKRRSRDLTISSTRTVKHDSFIVHAIRLKVQSMYAKREIATLDCVRKAVNEDDDLPNFTKTTLWRLIKDMGLTYDERIRNLGIIVWLRRYLRAIKEFRRQGMGESLMNFPGMCDLSVAALHTMVNWQSWSVDTFTPSLLAVLHAEPIPREGFVTATKQTVFPRRVVLFARFNVTKCPML